MRIHLIRIHLHYTWGIFGLQITEARSSFMHLLSLFLILFLVPLGINLADYEEIRKLSTAEVASFKSGKKIALTMMGWVTHGDKVSAGWR